MTIQNICVFSIFGDVTTWLCVHYHQYTQQTHFEFLSELHQNEAYSSDTTEQYHCGKTL